ncbi:RluA family pseudouridine synthase [Proteiniclasticum sp. QWL-01]|uniref:RluA family pseudouridine synthase n=1 Tax=Proteiniclasticum sp. QWL-01 TaxID=3036945 RepID=UPI0021FDA27B|nr:RluA family pseudouridine synthase [Proteiniclasticum sp. QWL-01]UUM10700.1 RluA family pseudouridine synthase [Clostridiaceae bacterium HFYG-1003]WFF72030.1 RluA family pseudouridine synthase [Proteiniclasticum sp. QWL-01]
MIIKIGPNEAGQSVEKYVKKLMRDVPLSAIHKALRKGDVRLNGAKAKDKDRLSEGDELEIRYLESRKAVEKKTFMDANVDFKVVFEDQNILMVEKWPGVVVHPDGSEQPSLTDHVLSYLAEKGAWDPAVETTYSPSPVNRLDRNTSGIVIFGKNAQATRSLAAILKDGGLRKDYVAIVKGRIPDGRKEAFISKDADRNVSRIYEEAGTDRLPIVMETRTMESNGLYSFVELNLITGRSHQLRAHLSHMGNPIVGDRKYGSKEINAYFDNKYALKFQYLYAYKVTFLQTDDFLSYLQGKVITVKLPPLFRHIKSDVFRVEI